MPHDPRPPVRIAMWSGPRNISTAMMRSFENRPDCAVIDEPLYAHYLRATGTDHPGRDEIIATHEPDWTRVVSSLLGPIPGGKPIWYQKHMAHHLLPSMGRDWVAGLTNCFLIRDPAEVITSFIKIVPNPTAPDLGLPQQVELFESERRRIGRTPPVIDGADILRNPRAALAALCEALSIPFTDRMLTWPAGPRASDGIWARHWYASVEKSTGFEPYKPKNEPVPDHLAGVHAHCRTLYDTLAAHRIRI
ncbi:MAG: hypothetical protein KF902_12425 [Phycisphaeraceae bacterium]|nr:hypothetical protein [Phycisphaeraceae bacterium]